MSLNLQRVGARNFARASALSFLGLVLVLLVGFGGAVPAGIGVARADEPSAERDSKPPGTIEFKGENLFSTANGRFHSWRVLESAIDLQKPAETYAIVEIDLDSVDTGIERRDDHLRNPDFFEVETYPVARVRAHNLAGKGQSESGNPLYSVDFDIDLHGVEKTVPGEVEQVSVSPPVFRGRLTIDRTEFGVGAPASRWNPMAVKELVPVSFEIGF